MTTTTDTPVSWGLQPYYTIPALWDQLRTMDPLATNFANTLQSILEHEEYSAFTDKLEGKDLVAFVDQLDTALNSLTVDTDVYKITQKALSEICSLTGQIPTADDFSHRITLRRSKIRGGEFSNIFLGDCNGKTYIVKELDTGNIELIKKRILKPAVVWKRLDHPCILPFFGVAINEEGSLCLVIEQMSANLRTHVKNNPDVDRVRLVYEIAQGLDYLHSRGFIHAGMKDTNVLIDEFGHVKIADLELRGITTTVDFNYDSAGNSRAACRWLSPEMLDANHPFESEEDSQPADVWGFSFCAIVAFTGEIPLAQYSNKRVSFEVVNNKRRPDRPENSLEVGLSDEIWNILQACWDTNPHERPKMSAVVKVFAKALGIVDAEEAVVAEVIPATSLPKDGSEAILKNAGGLPKIPDSIPPSGKDEGEPEKGNSSAARDRTAAHQSAPAEHRGGCCVIQ